MSDTMPTPEAVEAVDTALQTRTVDGRGRGVYLSAAITSVLEERKRQNAKWGAQRHSWPEWIAILTEEVGEASQETVQEHFHPTGDLLALRTELVHVAAVAVQIVEHVDECLQLRRKIEEEAG